jgi:hypothetical protein
LEDNNVMDTGATTLNSGDKLILSAGNDRRVWTVSAVNNQVVKYFDENGRYGQMPLAHLVELMKNHQLDIEMGGA